MTTINLEKPILSDELLSHFVQHCGSYDRENRFFQEDFDDLKQVGYLTINVPRQFGGRGPTLAEVCREQRHSRHRPRRTAAVGVDPAAMVFQRVRVLHGFAIADSRQV